MTFEVLIIHSSHDPSKHAYVQTTKPTSQGVEWSNFRNRDALHVLTLQTRHEAYAAQRRGLKRCAAHCTAENVPDARRASHKRVYRTREGWGAGNPGDSGGDTGGGGGGDGGVGDGGVGEDRVGDGGSSEGGGGGGKVVGLTLSADVPVQARAHEQPVREHVQWS